MNQEKLNNSINQYQKYLLKINKKKQLKKEMREKNENFILEYI